MEIDHKLDVIWAKPSFSYLHANLGYVYKLSNVYLDGVRSIENNTHANFCPSFQNQALHQETSHQTKSTRQHTE